MKRLWNRYTQLLLLIVVGVSIVLVGTALQNKKLENQTTLENVLVAVEDIPPYGELTESNTKLEERVKSNIPDDALRSIEDLKAGNSFASSYGLIKGNVVQKSYLTTASESKLGTSVSLPVGMYEVGVKIDLVTAAGGEVKAGTIVDAIAVVSQNGGTGGQTIRNKALMNLTVRKIVNSEGMTPDPEEKSNMTPAVAVIEVNAQQRDLLVGYQENGKVYFAPAGTQKVKK